MFLLILWLALDEQDLDDLTAFLEEPDNDIDTDNYADSAQLDVESNIKDDTNLEQNVDSKEHTEQTDNGKL